MTDPAVGGALAGYIHAMTGSYFKLFASGALDDFLSDRLKRMRADVAGQTEAYILGVSPEQYEAHLVSISRVEPPAIDFDAASAERREVTVPAERFPRGFFVERGKSYLKPAFVYFLPLQGSGDVLRFYPNPRIHWSAEVFLQGGCLCIELVCFQDTTDDVRREFEEFSGHLRTQLGYAQAQLAAHNASLVGVAAAAIRERREAVLKRHELAASLGVPIRRRDDAPATFRVPVKGTLPKIVPRPSVPAGAMFAPEPALDLETYAAILRNIYDFGKAIERMPSTYQGKSEENLRDFLLTHLEPNFAGSATGETFNRTGKTDILLRYESSNVFVAECKVWRGSSEFLAAMDQLLRYLTWRDSKAALIVFAHRADFSAVMLAARSAMPTHPNHLRAGADGGESWLNHVVHVNGDRNREVRVAVLLFHLPDSKAS